MDEAVRMYALQAALADMGHAGMQDSRAANPALLLAYSKTSQGAQS